MKKTNNLSKFLILAFPMAIICFATPLLSMLTLGKKATNLNQEANAIVMPYNEFLFDYIVRQPSSNQISDFKNADSCSKVIEYSYLSFAFTINNELVDQKLLSTNNEVEYTEYISKRLCEKTEDVYASIYVDYNFATKNNLHLNDKLVSGNFEFTITRIYQYYDPSTSYVPNLKQIYLDKGRSEPKTTGVYVLCKDRTKFYNDYLKNYVPLNELKEKREDQTQEEYNQYLVEFYSKDYSSRITDKQFGKENAVVASKEVKSNSSKQSIYCALLSTLICLICSIAIFLICWKKMKNEVITYGNSKSIYKRCSLSFISALLFSIGGFLLASCFTSGTTFYISQPLFISTNLLTLIITAVSILMAFVLSLILIKTATGKNA